MLFAEDASPQLVRLRAPLPSICGKMVASNAAGCCVGVRVRVGVVRGLVNLLNRV